LWILAAKKSAAAVETLYLASQRTAKAKKHTKFSVTVDLTSF
jgi:hypothetical protein